MTTKLEQAARQIIVDWDSGIHLHEAITALREALAEQAEQEPVAWALSHSFGLEFSSKYPMQTTKEAAEQMARQHMGAVVVTPLYAAPVQQAEQEPVAWKHDCAALCANHIELWIDNCPHCGKPRPAPVQQAEQEPVCECRRKTDAVISAEKEL